MAVSVQDDRRRAWNARMDRINSGRTWTQRADAEGTVPTKLRKGPKQQKGFRGIFAWIMGGTISWGIATAMAVTGPASQAVSQYDLGQFGTHVEAYGDPIAAAAMFLIALAVFKVQGLFPRLLGITIMAWVFALQFGYDVPTVASLIDLGEAMIAGDETFASALDALAAWAGVETA